MWALTGFADEAANDFAEQLQLLQTLGLHHIELRSAWGTKVLDLTPDQLATAKSMLDDAGITLSAVGADLGKIRIGERFRPHLERARHAMEVAHHFGCTQVRTFSFFIPEGTAERHRGKVIDRVGQIVDVAAAAGITMLHENEKAIYGDIPERVVDLATSIDSPHLRFTFDPANYVQCGVRPFDDALPLVLPYTSYVHIKDATMADGSVVPAGEGDGQVPEVLAALRDAGYDGFLSIEPHLAIFDAFGGLCGPDLWTKAHTALVGILTDLGIEFS